jgi:hypothetical protein
MLYFSVHVFAGWFLVMLTQHMNAIKQLKRIGLKLNSYAFGASIGMVPRNLTFKSLVYNGTTF